VGRLGFVLGKTEIILMEVELLQPFLDLAWDLWEE
jgi:hypothetical protein